MVLINMPCTMAELGEQLTFALIIYNNKRDVVDFTFNLAVLQRGCLFLMQAS